MEVSAENALVVWPSDDRVGTPDEVVFLADGPAPDAGRKESKRIDLEKLVSGKAFHQPFINSRRCSPRIRLKMGRRRHKNQQDTI